MSDFKLKVSVHDNTPEVKTHIRQRTVMALAAMGEIVEGYAKEECPVDTGRLRNSITHSAGDNCEYVGSNVEYAPVVEFNDSYHHTVGKAHFLRDAGQDHIDEIRKTAQDVYYGL